MRVEHEHLSALWLATLQRLADVVAHDVRNALNGVAVNVEVVRSRSARGADASAIAPFATAAASQLEVLSGQADALVSLLRPTEAAVDLGALLGRFAALFKGASGKGTLDVELPVGSGAIASKAGGDATRLALAAALLAALAREGRVVCRLGTDDAPTVYISCEAGGPLTLAQDIADTVTTTGIRLTPSPSGITLTFPSSLRD
jgi:signal transduction histidine kinase